MPIFFFFLPVTLLFCQDLVRETQINWKVFEGTYLTPDQFDLIHKYDKADRAGRVSLFTQSGAVHAFVLTHLLASLKQQDHLKYVLVLIEEILEEFPIENRQASFEHFLGLCSENKSLPMSPFLALLDMQDHYLQYLAAELVGLLLFARSDSQDLEREEEANELLKWILATLKKGENSSDHRGERAAIKCLQNVLQKDSMRVKFSEMNGVISLGKILDEQFKAVMESKKQESDPQNNRDLVRLILIEISALNPQYINVSNISFDLGNTFIKACFKWSKPSIYQCF